VTVRIGPLIAEVFVAPSLLVIAPAGILWLSVVSF
jgi:hypothetical protein